MIFLQQHHLPGRMPVEFFQSELRAPDVVIARSLYRDCRFSDASKMACRRGQTWSKLAVVLRGEVRVQHASGHAIARRGDAILGPRWSDNPMQPLTSSSEGLTFIWRNDGLLGGESTTQGVVRLAPSTLRRLEALSQVEEMRRGSVTARALIETMRAEGQPFELDGVRAASSLLSAAEQRFATAAYSLMWPLSRHPMLADVASVLGLSARHAVRVAQTFLRRCYVSIDSFRTLTRSTRITYATMFLSARGVSIDEVARAAGFSSVPSLYHAFESVGLPSPGAMQRAFAES